MRYLITGGAGFIGFHLARLILVRNKEAEIKLIDNLNEYYDVNLKLDRLKQLGIHVGKSENQKTNQSSTFPNLSFDRIDLVDQVKVRRIFDIKIYDVVVHLAAQAGVRYSYVNPDEYFRSNVVGFYNLLSIVNSYDIKTFLYASSSSVYGNIEKSPFHEEMKDLEPLNIYGLSKLSNEQFASYFAHNYQMRIYGMRFFTVYGPWGRPDMALFKFVKNIISGNSIDVYNRGNLLRDFTFVDDVAKAIIALIDKLVGCQTETHEVFNISANNPVKLLDFIKLIEANLGKQAVLNLLPYQRGEMFKTHGLNQKLIDTIDHWEVTDIENGIQLFIHWFINYYNK